jgi:hypothetical protein
MLLRLLLIGLFAGIVTAGPVAAAECATVAGPAAFSYDQRAQLQLIAGPVSLHATSLEREVRFASGGRPVSGLLMRPRTSSGVLRGAGILWVHWLGDPVTTNRTEFIADARALAALGATSLLVDATWSQPNWFERGRSPTTDACNVRPQVIALRRALDLLATQSTDPARIAYVGHDFGAMYGSLLLAVDPRPSRAVLMTPALSFWEWFLLGATPADPGAYVTAMSPFDLPVWLVHSHASATLLQFGRHDAYVSEATAGVIGSLVRARGRTVKSYDSDHSLRVAAATDDRRAWLVRQLSK